jgi:hypothetical protein
MPAIDFDRDDWEMEAERLLEWSHTLDFDAYLTDWTGIGTSSHTMLTSKFRGVTAMGAAGATFDFPDGDDGEFKS